MEKEQYPSIDEMFPVALKYLQAHGKVRTGEMTAYLADYFNVSKELRKQETPCGASQWGLKVNDVRKTLVKQGLIYGDKEPGHKKGLWELKGQQQRDIGSMTTDWLNWIRNKIASDEEKAFLNAIEGWLN